MPNSLSLVAAAMFTMAGDQPAPEMVRFSGRPVGDAVVTRDALRIVRGRAVSRLLCSTLTAAQATPLPNYQASDPLYRVNEPGVRYERWDALLCGKVRPFILAFWTSPFGERFRVGYPYPADAPAASATLTATAATGGVEIDIASPPPSPASAPAHAPDWRMLVESDDSMWFVDANSIRRSGTKVEYQIYNFHYEPVRDKWPDTGEAYAYDVMLTRSSLDCEKRTVRSLEISLYLGRTLVSRTSARFGGDVRPITPGRLLDGARPMLCGDEPLSTEKIEDPFEYGVRVGRDTPPR